MERLEGGVELVEILFQARELAAPFVDGALLPCQKLVVNRGCQAELLHVVRGGHGILPPVVGEVYTWELEMVAPQSFLDAAVALPSK